MCSVLVGIVVRDEHCMICKHRIGNLTHSRMPGKMKKHRGGGVVFFSPPTFPSQIVLVNQTSYLRLETFSAPLPFNPILGLQEG